MQAIEERREIVDKLLQSIDTLLEAEVMQRNGQPFAAIDLKRAEALKESLYFAVAGLKGATFLHVFLTGKDEK
jgi:hypothetical protein